MNPKKNISFTLSALVGFLKKNALLYKETKFDDLKLFGFSSILNPRPQTVMWIGDCGLYTDKLKSAVILCPDNFNPPQKSDCVFLFVNEPRRAFAKCLEEFAAIKSETGFIAKTAKVSESSTIGSNVSIGEYSIIESGVSIGNNTEIEDYVCIKSGTSIGNNCRIKNGVVIGGEGFGFYKDSDAKWRRFPQIGKVIINDDVEVGAYSVIDRATLDETIIGKGTKLDSYVYIAHNVILGEDNIITAKVVLAGSASTGRNVWIGPSSCVLEGCHIGENSYIGMGTVIIRPVEPNCKAAGVPGKIIGKIVN
jgi:UDP-3-O-[3-hydroxymyristoyl] glucosamine N-acyltransferase